MKRPDVDYTVVLIFPSFGAEREYAEGVVEAALEWLNTNKEEPGFRFAPQVSAHLEIVQDLDEARAKIAADERVAMVLVHGVEDEERDRLFRECADQDISRCSTIDDGGRKGPRRQGRRKRDWNVVIRKRDPNEIHAHRLAGETLTAPLDDQEAVGDRVGQLIAVLALGVMEHHWTRNPPHLFS
jgi:hypothetical protein